MHVTISQQTEAVTWPTAKYCAVHDGLTTETRCEMKCDAANQHIVIDPNQLQKEFRNVADSILFETVLPDLNWRHGGFNSPGFSGFRKHGPASLYPFIYESPYTQNEYRVNIDLTLAMRLPPGIPPSTFNISFNRLQSLLCSFLSLSLSSS